MPPNYGRFEVTKEEAHMTDERNGRLVILSGPSCVGKSPLAKGLAKFHPGLRKTLQPLVLYNSRDARPGEIDGVDYHFRSREQIEDLKAKNHFMVMDVRGDLQALDLQELSVSLAKGDVFFEGNPFVGRALQTSSALVEVNRLSVFMSPLSRNEILFLKAKPNVSLPDLVVDVMRRKLLRRTRRQKGELSLGDLENIEKRASSAYRELHEAHYFQHVIPNHDGEDSENWDAFYYPLGDARLALLTFVSLLTGNTAAPVEHWEEELIP
jgi:guanylate kinase